MLQLLMSAQYLQLFYACIYGFGDYKNSWKLVAHEILPIHSMFISWTVFVSSCALRSLCCAIKYPPQTDTYQGANICTCVLLWLLLWHSFTLHCTVCVNRVSRLQDLWVGLSTINSGLYTSGLTSLETTMCQRSTSGKHITKLV